ncbi:MAG: response regulator [Pseudohongiellaceae bacterium]
MALSIDDDRTSQLLMAAYLKDINFCDSLIRKSNGQEALDYFRRAAEGDAIIPNIVFLDIKMPILDGWGFLDGFSELTDKLHPLPLIVMVSATKTIEDSTKADAHPLVTDLILKPISADSLVKLTKCPQIEKYFLESHELTIEEAL